MNEAFRKSRSPELSVVLPCRNEEKALSDSIQTIRKTLLKHNINAEIIVSDSSTDRSPVIAIELGAILVKHDKKGYGRAYLEGFKVAKGKYLFCADPDGTYNFEEIPRFIKYLRKNYDFVIGNRLEGKIAKGSMPRLSRYVGNPFISRLINILFKNDIGDALCGMRAINANTIETLNLKSEGMEFAAEMVIKATNNELRVKELAINYYPRKGKSKLNTLSDGWRHIKLIMYSAIQT